MLTTLVMLLSAVPGPGQYESEPPTDAEVLRALPKIAAVMPRVYEEFRDDIVIVKNQIGKPKIAAARFFPIAGKAALSTTSWECIVYYTNTIIVNGQEARSKKVAVVYIDRNSLLFGK